MHPRGLLARLQLRLDLLRGLAVDGAAELALGLDHLFRVRVRIGVRVGVGVGVRARALKLALLLTSLCLMMSSISDAGSSESVRITRSSEHGHEAARPTGFRASENCGSRPWLGLEVRVGGEW